MPKPINENIRDIRVENSDGDLVSLLDHAGSMFSELVNAVVSTNKAGTLTMKISIKPSTAGALATKADVSMSKPKGLPPESLMWPTPEGNLVAEDPRQTKLDLKPVNSEPKRELKSVTA